MRRLFGIPVESLAVILLVAMGAGLTVVAVLAARHPVFLRLGLRNALRRRGRSVVIVLGLMLGTAIIASALATGDTMSRTIRSSVLTSLGDTDELVATKTARPELALAFGTAADPSYLPAATFDLVRDRLRGSDLVDGVAPAIIESVGVQDVTRRTSEPRISLFAPDPAHLRGFGRITVDGRTVSLADLRPGEVLLDREAADRLDARPGDRITVFAGPSPARLVVRDVVAFRGGGGDTGAALLPLDHAQRLLGRPGEIKYVMVSNAGGALGGAGKTDAVRELLRPVLAPRGLEARPVKADGLDAADASGEAFLQLFTTFGMFTITAGILLIFLIFVMLAAERRSEMGTARAVGMQRRHLVEVFVDEGAAYDLAAAAVGTALGVGIAFVMIELVANAVVGDTGIEIAQGVEPSSMAIAYSLGVLLTLVVVAVSAWRVSRLNIVTAIRDLPEPPRRVPRRRRGLIGLAVLGLGVLATASGASAAQGTLFLLGVSIVLLGGVLLARALGVPDRVAFTVGGVALVVWWLLPFSVYRELVPDLELDFSVWVMSGVMVVLGVTWTVMYNADLVAAAFSGGLGRIRRLAPVLRTSVAYPLRSRFRTGTTLALFTLVVFTLVVGSTTSDAFTRAVDDEATFGGGFQVQAETAPSKPIPDLRAAIARRPGLDPGAIRTIAAQSFVPAEVRQAGPDAGAYEAYALRGVDDAFVRTTTFGLAARARGFRSDRAVWRAMARRPRLAIVDPSVVPRRTNWSFGPQPDFRLHGFSLEDERFDPVPLEVRDPLTGKVTRLTVVGVLKDTAPYALAGITTSQRALTSFGDRAAPTAYFLTVAPGVDPVRTAKRLESAFLANGMEADAISDVLADVVGGSRTFQRIILGFLGLGLVIGVAALGVISARSVVERRQHIGVLRAIGFRRGMVQASFLIESSMIALTSIVVGTALGLMVSYTVIADSASQPSWSNLQFAVPWTSLAVVFVVVYAAALLATWLPARRASSIEPAAALRYQ